VNPIPQALADAAKVAPSAGDPAAGSVLAKLSDIEEDTGEIGEAGAGLTAVAAAVVDQALEGHVSAGTVGEALQLARAQAGGQWSISGDVLRIYDISGNVLVTFDLAPAGGPYTARVPR
jgi:hypothetical protein